VEDKVLKRIKENQNTLPKYLNAMSELTTSGIFEYIRSLGRVKYLKADSPETIAVQAGWSKGFNDALDILFNFQELYLDKQEENNAPPLDFGAIDIMLEQDLITKEEADAYRNGTDDTLLATYLATVSAAKSGNTRKG
jgi:hypothetical protein